MGRSLTHGSSYLLCQGRGRWRGARPLVLSAATVPAMSAASRARRSISQRAPIRTAPMSCPRRARARRAFGVARRCSAASSIVSQIGPSRSAILRSSSSTRTRSGSRIAANAAPASPAASPARSWGTRSSDTFTLASRLQGSHTRPESGQGSVGPTAPNRTAHRGPADPGRTSPHVSREPTGCR